MKREISLTERPARFTLEYMKACGNMSWYDFVAGMPSLVFLVTGWKANGKENACLQSWSSFVGGGPEEFICIMGKVNRAGHMHKSLRETGVCVINFPSNDIYEKCIKTIGHNEWETDEIAAAGLTAERAKTVNAPRIRECFLNLECEFLWEHELFEGSGESAVAVKVVGMCMDEERFDQDRLGRYGKSGYLFQIDQPTNPLTGETAGFGPGVLMEGEPVEWITK